MKCLTIIICIFFLAGQHLCSAEKPVENVSKVDVQLISTNQAEGSCENYDYRIRMFFDNLKQGSFSWSFFKASADQLEKAYDFLYDNFRFYEEGDYGLIYDQPINEVLTSVQDIMMLASEYKPKDKDRDIEVSDLYKACETYIKFYEKIFDIRLRIYKDRKKYYQKKADKELVVAFVSEKVYNCFSAQIFIILGKGKNLISDQDILDIKKRFKVLMKKIDEK